MVIAEDNPADGGIASGSVNSGRLVGGSGFSSVVIGRFDIGSWD